MKKILSSLFISGMMFLSLGVFVPVESHAQAAAHTARIQTLHSPDARRCFFFRLQGVTTTHPAAAGPWFSIPLSDHGFNVKYSQLLAAKLAGLPVTVHTDGPSAACVAAFALRVQLN